MINRSLEIAQRAEPIFRVAAERIVKQNAVVRRKELVDACSAEAGISPTTGSKYLDKMAARYANNAAFDYVKGRDLKKYFPDFEGLDDDEYYVRLRDKQPSIPTEKP